MTKKVQIDIVAKDKTKQAIGRAKRGLGGLKTFALAASAALATIGATKAIGGLIRTGKEVENLKVRFKFLFGSAEEGAKSFDTLAKFASKVPFSLEEISRASGNLAVVAKDARQLESILEITGNVAAATGLDFETTASQIQRAFAGGIASADIFREKGVRDMLGFSAGAKVSVEETRKAFATVFAGNGEFAGTTAALADTLEGTTSMIGDKFFQLKNAINEGFFTEVKAQFTDFNNSLAANEEQFLAFGRAVGQVLGTALKEFVEQVKLVVAAFQFVGRTIDKVIESSRVLTGVVDLLLKPFQLVGDAVGYIADNNEKWTETLNTLNQDVIPTSIKQSGEFTESLNNIAIATGEVNIATEKLRDTMGTLGTGDDFFSQRASASRQAVKDLKAEKDAEEALIDGKKRAFEEAKKLAAEGSQRSKKMFRLQQALNIGQAIMSTYTGASNALRDIPPPFNFAVAALTVATGLAQVANIRSQQPPAQFGGARQANQPFLVGEKGAELFTPATAGTVTPNHQLGDKMGATVVNFNINTVSAKGFNELLNNSRGMITNMINQAVNEKGKANLI